MCARLPPTPNRHAGGGLGEGVTRPRRRPGHRGVWVTRPHRRQDGAYCGAGRSEGGPNVVTIAFPIHHHMGYIAREGFAAEQIACFFVAEGLGGLPLS